MPEERRKYDIELLERMGDVKDRINKVHGSVIALEVKQEAITNRQDVHSKEWRQSLIVINESHENLKKILNGNGKVGLVSKVEQHADYIQEQKKGKRELATWIFRSLIGIAITYIVAHLTIIATRMGALFNVNTL